MKLAEMTWPDVAELNRDVVIIAPIAALEQHGKHLPFFTDSILCEAVANRVETELQNDSLLLPLQWLGASSHHLGMAGTLTAENDTYLKLLCEPLRCLLRAGFRRALILNGHGGNIDGYHLALRQLAFEFPEALLTGASYWDFATQEIAAILEGSLKHVGHACEFETSLMLYLRPDLVRQGEITDDYLSPQPSAMSPLYIPLDMKRQTKFGGTGQPSLGTADKGRRLMEAIAVNAVAAIRAMRTKPL